MASLWPWVPPSLQGMAHNHNIALTEAFRSPEGPNHSSGEVGAGRHLPYGKASRWRKGKPRSPPPLVGKGGGAGGGRGSGRESRPVGDDSEAKSVHFWTPKALNEVVVKVRREPEQVTLVLEDHPDALVTEHPTA